MLHVIIGTIRGDFALAVGRNICHGSDSVENAEKEIRLLVFFFLA
jgi:nucleoside-diphosphate kinase